MNIKFHIKKMILWLNDGTQREIEFKNDKVNVITGNSKTGKTAILEIIDYCLCGSESNISYEHIGENVLWYGLNFNINGKIYTVARGKLENETSFSKDYYFSSVGVIPEMPTVTIGQPELKVILEEEFSINSKVTFNYGGNALRKYSKISYRYFLLFNTLSGDVINHSKNYFDKLDLDRYREALPRIFDLALGITTIDNIMLKDSIDKIEREISKIEKEKVSILREIEEKNTNLQVIIKKAKEGKIISPLLVDFDQSVEELKKIFETGNLSFVEIGQDKEIEILKGNKQLIEIQIAKLKRFKKRYTTYKEYLEKEQTALKPIKYIKKNFSENISNEEYLQFLNLIESEFNNIKKAIKEKLPFEYGVDDKIVELEKELSKINEQFKVTPDIDDVLKSDWKRLISIGEIKAEFSRLTNQVISSEELDLNIERKEKQLDGLNGVYVSPEEKKVTIIEALNDYIQTYIEVAEAALDEYGKYLANFDYSRKVLKLRKSKATSTANITSSSDHLFMHLCLFLGMHQLIMDTDVPFVLPFLIIDQPSRPYFNNNTFDYDKSKESLSKKDDWTKVKEIFSLLDTYFDNILKDEKHFQIILLEHVSTDAWDGCNHIHLVEIFDGEKNALIPPSKKVLL